MIYLFNVHSLKSNYATVIIGGENKKFNYFNTKLENINEFYSKDQYDYVGSIPYLTPEMYEQLESFKNTNRVKNKEGAYTYNASNF